MDNLQNQLDDKASFGVISDKPIFKAEQQHLRWAQLKNMEARAQYQCISEEVFPFLRTMGEENSAFNSHMQGARFTLPAEKAGLLSKVIEMLENIPMNDRDTKGDLYEYLLSKLSTAGQNGQFRTPRHIIKMMVELMQPQPDDIICDPACGTAGFLVAAAEYLRQNHQSEIFSEDYRQRYDGAMFHGFDFDSTMLRIASMNMILHGINQPMIQNKDSLSADHGDDANVYSLILANPPFNNGSDIPSVISGASRP